jgi:hypothetical protein
MGSNFAEKWRKTWLHVKEEKMEMIGAALSGYVTPWRLVH